MNYQLGLQAEYLAQLCFIWKSKIWLTPGGDSIPDDVWGPTATDLSAIQSFEFHESTAEAESEDRWVFEEESEVEDAELLEAIELSALADEFRSGLQLEDQ